MMLVDEQIRAMVSGSIDSKTIKKAAVSKGMGTLRQDGARKVLSGTSSIAEVLRATEEEESTGQI
jgi:general secretion pathway protein E